MVLAAVRRAAGGLSLRARLILLGLTGLAVALGVGAAALVLALGFALQRTVDVEASATARDVAALVDAQALPDPVPVAGAQIVQVVDAAHRVRAGSITADRLVPMLSERQLAQARAGRRLVVDGERIGVEGPVRVYGVPAGPPDDPQTVVVARPIGELQQSVALLRTALLIVYPLLLLVLAALAWRVVGAALRPVEALRAGAERITGSATAERLPVSPSRDEIARLAVTLNDMLDRLAGARARQRAFVADAAHELRSPLASMRTQLEVAARLGAAGQPPDELIADLLVDVERLSRLVNDLLLLARTDDQAPAGHREPVELRALLRAAAQRGDGSSGGDGGSDGGSDRDGGRSGGRDVGGDGGRDGPGVRVRSCDGEPLWTVGEPDALRRIVDNLVDNAVRHARAAVDLDVTAAGRYQLISVTDDGPGIVVADRERVFERFTRLDDARARDAGGTGLGLAIVRELARRHGGTVLLTDPAGAQPGTRVEVRLPAAPAGPD
jgi:signal transduction histidine kinase